MSNEEIIWKYFENKNFTPYAIAGIMGNMEAESGFKPNNLENSKNISLGMTDEEYTEKVDTGIYKNFIYDQAGYGLVQFTFWSLKKELYDLCQERNKSIADMNCQLDCIYQQIKSRKLDSSLNNSKSVREASDIFLLKYERPKNQSEENQKARAERGQRIYNQFANKQTSSVKGGNGKMKYDGNNKPLVCMMTNSTCYKSTSKMTVKGVLWHSTGANNPWLKRYVQPSDNAPDKAELLAKLGQNSYRNDWNHQAVQAGLNAWIGKLADGTVTTVQTMPWDYKPWGCGSGSKGSCNDGWIQFEICEDGLSDKSYFDKIYKEACEFTAYICSLYNLNPKGTVSKNGINVPVILCHQDSYKLGLGSNHSDVYHWFNRYGKSMDTVRNDVANLMGGNFINTTTPSSSTAVKPSVPVGMLGLGSEGAEVKQLQENLMKLGYKLPKYGADGDFGDETLQAVLQFQKDKNIEQDGIVGPATKACITAAIKSLDNTPTVAPTPTPERPVIPEKLYYRVRKSWEDVASQVGAYLNLDNAIAACQAAGPGYKVFNAAKQVVYEYKPEKEDKPIVVENPVVEIEPIPKYNGVVIGSSSKDENGAYRGGQAGDQTGKEVYTMNWYNGGWIQVIRPKSSDLANKIASACEKACNNKCVGYDQGQRNTLMAEARKVGLDISKITTPCECDCSSLVSACCVCAGLSEGIFFSGGNGRTTNNLLSACQQTGQFGTLSDAQYITSKDYLKRGDILLASGHTVIVLSNGSKAETSTAPTPIQQPTSTYKVRVTTNLLNVRTGPSKENNISTKVKKGEVFTIIQEEGGWGKLKSGAGWIDLSYTEKI